MTPRRPTRPVPVVRRPRCPRRRLLLLALSALPLFVASTWLLTTGPLGAPSMSVELAHGAALWAGTRPLEGRISGHATALPAAATRCINCHAAVSTPAGLADPARDSAAPRLTAQQLQQLQPRRGGPPSRYDVAAFCTLLRTGVDPAVVLLPRQMPRYAIAETDCRALWAFLVSEGA
jgi:hypothetical protein